VAVEWALVVGLNPEWETVAAEYEGSVSHAQYVGAVLVRRKSSRRGAVILAVAAVGIN